MTTSNWKFGKRLINEAAETLKFERPIFRAWQREEVAGVHILELRDEDGEILREEDCVTTRKVWVMGYSDTHGWAATNGKRAWQFRDANVLESFAKFLAKTDWEVIPV